MDDELFRARTRTPATADDLETAAAVARKLGDVAILGYTGDQLLPNPWFCFDVGERKFAIWRATGKLYEGDQYGAMGDDPIKVKDL